MTADRRNGIASKSLWDRTERRLKAVAATPDAPTPRKDAFVSKQEYWLDTHWVDFARNLERENYALKEAITSFVTAIDKAMKESK